MTVLHFIALVVGFVMLVATLLDAFESILLPRRINHSLRYSRLYYRTFWTLWRRAAGRVKLPRYREGMLSVFGPMSMLGLFCSWISALVIAFALIQWALPSDLANAGFVDPSQRFTTYLYFSGTTFFTLGMGDFTPVSRSGRALAVLESGLGLGFLAIIIGYLPVLYQAFSRREVTISLLDARAGSPPSGTEFILRLAQSGQIEGGRIEAVDRGTDGMGAVVCRAAGEPHLIPRAGVLPIAAREPVLAGGPDDDAGCVQPAAGPDAGGVAPSGAADAGDGPACGGGYRPDLQHPASEERRGSLSGRHVGSFARVAGPRRPASDSGGHAATC